MQPNRTVAHVGPGPIERAPWSRIANLALGAWLFLSAFLWAHSDPSGTNTWIVGIVIMAFSALGMAVPWARWINMAAAVWLFCTALFFPHATTTTVWNNVLIAIAVFIVSMSPNRSLSSRLPT